MNKSQINKFRMYEAVDLGFASHSELIQKFDELISARQRLQAGLQVIGQNRQVQEVDRTGLTKNKVQLRSELVNLILQFSAAIKAYATVIKNLDLKTRANYNPSELKTVSDPVLADIGLLLKDLATPYSKELLKYFIGEAEFTELDRLLVEFKTSIPKSRAAGNVSKTSTKNIGGIFEAMDKLLREEIDVLMLPFQFKESDFYNIYKNARSIVNYTGRGKGLTTPVA